MESFAVLAGPPDKYRDMVVREISVLRATEPTVAGGERMLRS